MYVVCADKLIMSLPAGRAADSIACDHPSDVHVVIIPLLQPRAARQGQAAPVQGANRQVVHASKGTVEDVQTYARDGSRVSNLTTQLVERFCSTPAGLPGPAAGHRAHEAALGTRSPQGAASHHRPHATSRCRSTTWTRPSESSEPLARDATHSTSRR